MVKAPQPQLQAAAWMQQAPPEAQAIIGQLAAAWMQQRGQQGRGMVNPMGPSFAGGSAPDTNMLEGGSAPGPRVEEVFDRDGSPPPPTEANDSQARGSSPPPAAIERSTTALAVPEPQTSPDSFLMGSMGAKAGAEQAKPFAAGLPSMFNYMAKVQNMLGGKHAAPEPEVVGASDDDDVAEEADAPAGKTGRKKKARLSPPTAPATSKTKREMPPKDDRVLRFPGISKHAAIKYGQCTIYIDAVGKCWRLKKEPGSKDLVHFYFKHKKPEVVWKEVVKETKKYAK